MVGIDTAMVIKLEPLVLGGLILFILILLFLMIWISLSRKKNVRERKQAQKKLEDTLSNLEAVYSEVNTTQEELNAKYRELKASEDKIKKLAYEDNMTGLPNKTAFREVLDHTMETLRKDEFVAVIDLDLDNFKSVNEMLGNSYGDEMILDVSHRLKQNLDDNDYLAREGSDEFLILTQNISELEEYDKKVNRIQKAFRFPFLLTVGEFTITVSMGVVLGPKDGKTAGILLRRADNALNQAKWMGKNTYCYYTDALEKKQLEDMELRTELTAAMKENAFLIRYQPILSLKEKSYIGFETELYWDRKQKGIWRARRFDRFAEETGQIVALGERIFRLVCQDKKRWEKNGCPKFDIVIPLSRRELMNPSFEPMIHSISEEENLALSGFLFEIKESVLMEAYEDCRFLVNELSQRGCRFRLGDFGSGRMAFDCIRDLPVEQVALSIRRMFEDRELSEAKAYFQVVVAAIRQMGRRIVVTELSDAVEEKLLEELFGQEMQLVQGELYGEPLSAKEVAAGWQKGVSLE